MQTHRVSGTAGKPRYGVGEVAIALRLADSLRHRVGHTGRIDRRRGHRSSSAREVRVGNKLPEATPPASMETTAVCASSVAKDVSNTNRPRVDRMIAPCRNLLFILFTFFISLNLLVIGAICAGDANFVSAHNVCLLPERCRFNSHDRRLSRWP